MFLNTVGGELTVVLTDAKNTFKSISGDADVKLVAHDLGGSWVAKVIPHGPGSRVGVTTIRTDTASGECIIHREYWHYTGREWVKDGVRVIKVECP